MYYAGIDIPKRSLSVSILDDAGEMIRSPVSLPVTYSSPVRSGASGGNLRELEKIQRDKE